MNITELYQQKGEAVTQIEVWQAKLNKYNELIVKYINEQESSNKEKSKEQIK